ncbi:hypothetical protein [Herbaspirillum huttiense]|uniref:hypothetical protein n=1 Tax=Herbaspirillum huttiense TaxID=863372 RepID=UPI0004175349|nr:hypothetical protein [Herbaspirillum huttiense]
MKKNKGDNSGTDLSTANELRNKVRGALAGLAVHRPSTKVERLVQVRRHAQRLINDALVAARERLSGKVLFEFERWVDAQCSMVLGTERIGADGLVLGIIPNAIFASSLKDALALTLDSIKRAEGPLYYFCTKLKEINSFITSGDHESALEIVDFIVEEFGQSYWGIEAKIALLSSCGLTAQVKDFVTKLSVDAVGLNSFYIYYFGLRNEVSQSPSRLKTVVRRRLGESDLTDEYEAYVEFRVLRTVTTERRRLASILNHEHVTSKIDLLLTAVRISIEVVGNSEQFSEAEIALADQILNLDCVKAAYSTISVNSDLRLSQSLHDSIDEGISFAMGSHPVDGVADLGVFSSGFASMVSYSGKETDEDRLRQHTLNYWYTLDSLIFESAPISPRLPEIYAGIWHSESRHPLIKKIVGQFWHLENKSEFNEFDAHAALSEVLPKTLQELSGARSNSCVLDCIGVKLAWTAFESEMYPNALRISHLSLRRNNRLNEALPLRKMFSGIPFDVISSYGISLDLSNCLHWYSQIDPERQIRTFKRFSIEKWIVASGKVNLFDACEALINSHQDTTGLEFFLSDSADIATIELLLEIDGTRDALEVRSKILYLAADISDQHSAQLRSAADAIRDELDVGDVLDELDETMVSVDEAAILPLVERELASDFARYKSLIGEEEAENSSVDELVRSLRNQSAAAFQIPKSESGDLLINMIQTALDRFIDDAVYGLDAIIGRRIRHGTISSELRGTLEQAQLIGQRPRSGADYDAPKRIMADLANPSINKRGVVRAIGRFSAAIDLLVAQLRDEVFQCKPKGKLEPVFELPISTLMFAAARDSAATAPSVVSFLAELFDTFWFMLSIYTDRHRVKVKHYTENALKEAFSKLLADFKGARYTDVLLHSSVQKASEELQRRAGVIAAWIQIPKARSSGRTYSLKLVFDAAIAHCKARWANFEPVSVESIDASIRLDAHGYPIVFDALRIALENIALHSGVRQGNRVETSIGFNEDCTKICFNIVSDASKDSSSKEKIARVESIREDIEKRSFADRAKRTSGSGLAKLATLVQQRQSCNISFGMTNGNKSFKLYFELMYIPLDRDESGQIELLEA